MPLALRTFTYNKLKKWYDEGKYKPYSEEENGEKYGKYLLIAGKSLWTIDSFTTEDL